MATNVIMPKQGLLMTEGTITRWLISEGDKIEKGKPLFEMETDKSTIEIMSPATGTLLKIIKGELEVVPIAESIAVIGEPREDISEFLHSAPIQDDNIEKENIKVGTEEITTLDTESESKGLKSGNRIFITPRAKKLAKKESVDFNMISGSGARGLIIERDIKKIIVNGGQKIKSTPVAKKMAQEQGINLAEVSGSGDNNRIQKGDIARVIKSLTNTDTPVREGKTIPFSGIRKIISDRMMNSLHTTAQANHRMKVDVSELVKLREMLKTDGLKVSFNDILVKIVSKALIEFQMINSSLTEEGILVKNYVNLGFAVSLSNGLIVPVIKDADLMTLKEINEVTTDLVEKAKNGTLQLDNYSGGSFTISNLGMFDIDEFTAIINPPESAILAVGKIDKVPVVDGDSIVIKPVMILSLTYDHRIIDGALAAQFLQRVKALIMNPYLLL